MKVENTHTNRLSHTQTEQAKSVEKNARSQAHEARTDALSGRDQADFSEKARQLAKARAELGEASDVRSDLVADLRQRIETDNYEVPLEALTRRIVALVKPD